MQSRTLVLACLLSMTLVAIPPAAAPAGDFAVTDHAYTRADGGTDVTITACSTNHRQQNEPTVAVDPRDSNVVTAGSNDYCATPTAGDAWRGYYLSTDGGATWNDSLVPGYWTDTSAAGQASPLYHVDHAAGDPVQAWDAHGRIFVMGNAFDRAFPNNANVWVATYDNPDGPSGATTLDGSRYVRTVVVGQGTPGVGRFNDKTAIEADRTGGACDGTVYAAWSLFSGNQGNNAIVLSRSTDHGATFTQPQKVSDGVHGNQFADLSVAPDGSVYLVWRSYLGRGQADAIQFAKSADCGATWSKPTTIASLASPFDSPQFSGCNCAGGQDDDITLDTAAATDRDCGDGALGCPSGMTFFRFDSFATVASDGSAVYVAYNQRDGSGWSQVYLIKSTNGGRSWSAATAVDPIAGHQLLPDMVAEGGKITLVYYDSRNDACKDPSRAMGNNATGISCGPSLDAYASVSSDGGASWTHERLSDISHNPNFEMFGNRRVPFHGDYIYVSSSGGHAMAVWTDNRDVVAGTDPRDSGPADGNDVHQCRTQNADGSWSADTCPNDGGLNQNIYANWA